MALDLKKLHTQQARRWRREAASKLRTGRGFDGRFLRPKIRKNGRPLGYGKTILGIPGRIKRGRVRAFLVGFDVTVAPKIGDVVFHTGRRNQVARPYAGFSGAQLKRNAQELVKALAKEGRRLKVFR